MVRKARAATAAFFCTAMTAAVFTLCCRPSGSGMQEIKSGATFKPDALYSENVELQVLSTSIPASFRSRKDGEFIVFEAVTHGAVIETERYQMTPEAFCLVEMAETYQPPLPLLKFPMSIASSWKWSGKLLTASIPHMADAAVNSELDGAAFGTDTIKVTVNLDVQSGGKPVKRKLEFWFVPGKGIAQRSYGSGLVRRPAKE